MGVLILSAGCQNTNHFDELWAFSGCWFNRCQAMSYKTSWMLSKTSWHSTIGTSVDNYVNAAKEPSFIHAMTLIRPLTIIGCIGPIHPLCVCLLACAYVWIY